MKKNLLLGIMFIACFTQAKAQFVTIPDTEFKRLLTYSVGGCFNAAGQLDTTCPAVLNLDTLNNYLSTTKSLEGLQYFKSLQVLTWRSSQVDTIPSFPKTLKIINLDHNNLHSLPPLPDSLTVLNIQENLFQTMPALPLNLKTLICGKNGLTLLTTLPANLTYIDCNTNQLTFLPTLPTALTDLNCNDNKITALPALPATLSNLNCNMNQLTSLPILPNTLRGLDCSKNIAIFSLPNTPDSLKGLNISNCSFSALAALPAQLQGLDIGYNPIGSWINTTTFPAALGYLNVDSTNLSILPSLPPEIGNLNVANNYNLSCLPILPSSLRILYYSSSGNVKCVSNKGPLLAFFRDNISSGNTTALPLCDPTNNAAGCVTFPIIKGTVFYDLNTNGLQDAGEPVRQGSKVSLSNSYCALTNANGYYEMIMDSAGTTVIKDNPPLFFKSVPDSATFTLTTGNAVQNFALQPMISRDSLEVLIIPFRIAARPGGNFTYAINYRNDGSTTFGSTAVSFSYDSTKLIYDSASNPFITRTGNVLTIQLQSLSFGSSDHYNAYFTVKTTAVLGSLLKADAIMTSGNLLGIDTNLVIIRNSYDPNDKKGTPLLTPEQVVTGKYIDYTIRFQNTGTDTAFHVVIADTLSSMLQWNTLEMIESSHLAKVTVKHNIADFEMRNILLPDSNVNEPASHGYIRFRIKPKNTLVAGDDIPNNAAIYFDYNTPVITNTAITQIRSAGALPLTLIRFKGVRTGNKDQLYWSTSNEINTKLFEIQTSADGRTFIKAGFVYARGRGNGDYNSTIEKPVGGNSYYRLKMVDIDGAYKYSNIILVRGNTKDAFVLASNPVKDKLILTVLSSTLANTEARLVNSEGVIVKTFTIKGTGTQTWNVSSLAPGVYYLQTKEGSEKVVVTR